MDRLQAITAFAKVVESGSFVRRRERLATSVSAVSRHVAELEAHLDVLAQSHDAAASLTESGSVFYQHCVQLLADLDEAEQSASASAITPRGTLRLSAR
jgi:DNA-binding transcriptional LysR family regulator